MSIIIEQTLKQILAELEITNKLLYIIANDELALRENKKKAPPPPRETAKPLPTYPLGM